MNNSTLISLQYEARDLSRNTSDDFGTCDVTQKLDQLEMQITKKNCQKSKNNNQQRDNYTENFLDNGNVRQTNEIGLKNIYIHQLLFELDSNEASFFQLINFQLFGSTTSRTFAGNYKLIDTKDIYTLCGTNAASQEKDVFSNVIGAVKIIETVKSKLNLHQDIGTLLQSQQELRLKGKTYSNMVKNL